MAENNPTIEDLKAPLLAAVGAADLALATANTILATLRERAELAVQTNRASPSTSGRTGARPSSASIRRLT